MKSDARGWQEKVFDFGGGSFDGQKWGAISERRLNQRFPSADDIVFDISKIMSANLTVSGVAF